MVFTLQVRDPQNFRRFGRLAINFGSITLFVQQKYGATAIQCNTITFLILEIEVFFSL